MFFKRRFAIVLSAFAVAVLAVTPPVSAGCLCDWLFGRPTTYAAAMPVTPAPAYAAAMPVTPTPAYSAAMPVSATAPLATVPAQTVPAQTALQPITTAPTSPYTAQMPAYGTAAPLSSGYAGQYSSLYGGTTPVAGSAVAAPAVTAAPITSFYGTGNVYPPIQPTSGYTANYAPGYTAGTAPAYTAAPTYAAAPAVTAVPARTGGLLGGIRGFFGNLFGTNYRTSYYRAPVTYYRPLTTVDPVSGSTVTVQRPCTAYQNQVQRTPYMGLQPAAATPAAACAPTLPPATYSSPAVGTSPAPAWQGGSTYGSGQSLPPQSLPGQPLTGQPLTGQPLMGQPLMGQPLMGQPGQTPSSVPQGDAAPVAPPALQRVPVPSTEAPETPRYWQAPPATTSSAAAPGPARGLPDPPSTYARPIPAPPTPWAQPSAKSAKPSTSSPQPSTQRDGFGEGGRTASRPAWGFKTIAWNASQDRGVQPAAYQESAYGEPGRYGDQTESALRIGERDTVAEPGRVAEPVRRENRLPNAGAAQIERRQPAMLNAPAQLAPRRNNPPRATQPAFDASHQDDSRNGGYDNSGWRASR